MKHSHRACSCWLCEGRTDLRAQPRVCKEREDEGEGCGCEDAVVKLRGDWVLEHVAPPEIGAVWAMRVEGAQYLRARRDEASSHTRELVVDEAGIEAGNEATGHGGEEDHCGNNPDRNAEKAQVGMREFGEFRERSFGVRCEEAMFAEDREPVPDHGGVDGKCGAEVRGETVLRYAWVGTRFLKKIVLDAGFDHPPTDKALKSDECGDTGDSGGHAGGDSTAGDKVKAGKNEGEANDTSPEPVRPLHVVDRLIAIEIHVWVQDAVFGRVAVFREIFFPGLGGQWREGACYGLPFCD